MAGWMLYLHALSPIHSGTGAAAGAIDLPVARERVTTWPYLPGSSVKGVLRDAAEQTRSAEEVTTIFGPPTDRADEGAGAVWFADAHLLCFPVRSFRGTFAWVTCRLALERWRRDQAALDKTASIVIPEAPPEGSVRLAKRGTLDYEDDERDDQGHVRRDGQNRPVRVTKIALEDFDLTVQPAEPATAGGDPPTLTAAKAIAGALFDENDWWHAAFLDRFAVVDDDTFTQLAFIATEVVARIRLNPESKTVARGALWYEEAVPTEAVFAAPLGLDPRRRNGANGAKTVLDALTAAPGHQVGGHAGVGRGLVRLRLV